MLTYQIRPRIFRTDGRSFPDFPQHGEVRLHLAPKQPFGVEAGGGRTAVKAVAAEVLFNPDNGEHSIESSDPLRPLDITFEALDYVVRVEGSQLTVARTFESQSEVSHLIETLYFALPVVLAIEFADPPFVQRIDGAIGDVPFNWVLEYWKAEFLTTTQEKQQASIEIAWDRLSLLAKPESRRLFAAMHYFHVAARLARTAAVVGEFLPEVILNLSKVLEVLFPPSGDGKTRDTVRARLKELDFSEDEIEGNYLPAMALRNEIDVGHVDLSLFKPEHLQLIHGYTDRAETAFRNLLSRVLTRVEEGTFTVPAYVASPATKQAVQVVERLRKYVNGNTQ